MAGDTVRQSPRLSPLFARKHASLQSAEHAVGRSLKIPHLPVRKDWYKGTDVVND